MRRNYGFLDFWMMVLFFAATSSEQETLSISNGWKMFEIPKWPSLEHPVWSGDLLQLLVNDSDGKGPPVTKFEDVLEKSNNFPIIFPIETIKSKNISQYVSEYELEKNINSVYPVVHESALLLYATFLLFKRKFGSNLERTFYKDMPLLQLVERLLTKRAVIFMNEYDTYMLLDGTQGYGQWETIGTDTEKDKLKLSNCLSYDEIKLSALLSVSSNTHFLNNGNRYNVGIKNTTNVESDGIIIGLIGTRLEKANVMEYQEIVVSENQNTEANGYGPQFAPTLRSIVSGFYGEVSFTYDQAFHLRTSERNRFTILENNVMFDNTMYCKRIALSIDTLLLEANDRALKKKTTAFVHVVGIGLGVWKISPHQNNLFLDTFGERIRTLGDKLEAVSDVFFAYFKENSTCNGLRSGETITIPNHPNNGIKIYIDRREPHTKLTGSDAGKLLVVSYAWDGNALPGNEFWLGSLAGSGDPAAASSTQIAEIHNPHINPQVCAENLRIATHDGVIPYLQYCRDLKESHHSP